MYISWKISKKQRLGSKIEGFSGFQREVMRKGTVHNDNKTIYVVYLFSHAKIVNLTDNQYTDSYGDIFLAR